MSGLSRLCHLSRHCLPVLPSKWLPTSNHLMFCLPCTSTEYFLTSSLTSLSSSAVHARLSRLLGDLREFEDEVEKAEGDDRALTGLVRDIKADALAALAASVSSFGGRG